MVDSAVHILSVLFAIVSGTGAGLLSILFWRVARDSPFGTLVALLSTAMSGIIIYHVVLFLFAPNSLFLDMLRSALYTILAIFIWLVIATHQQLKRTATGG